MILIDALYINNSGGKILLDYLIQELEKTNKNIFYLLDKRVEDNIPPIKYRNKILFIEASLFKRKLFYKQNSHTFSKVLCFGNLPPNIRIKAEVYTYFHQQLYLKVPDNLSFIQSFLFSLKRMVFNYFFQNTDYWLLQTDMIKCNFVKKFKISKEKVLVIPFYPSFKITEQFFRHKNTYLYVSNAPAHKNHVRLINAFCSFYNTHKLGKLILTVSEEFPELLEIIKNKKKLNYPIENLGFISREKLTKIYQESEYLIYPSLAESFGLGLVEAIENGCKIIGSDLQYTYAVCEPSIIFNPLDEESISKALSLSLQKNIKNSVAKVSNKIDELIAIL